MANELEILGSHGMQPYRYAEMIEMINAGKLSPESLIGETINLEESITVLTSMSEFNTTGVTVITEF
jgi:alcohol dehydrogenase